MDETIVIEGQLMNGAAMLLGYWCLLTAVFQLALILLLTGKLKMLYRKKNKIRKGEK